MKSLVDSAVAFPWAKSHAMGSYFPPREDKSINAPRLKTNAWHINNTLGFFKLGNLGGGLLLEGRDYSSALDSVLAEHPKRCDLFGKCGGASGFDGVVTFASDVA